MISLSIDQEMSIVELLDQGRTIEAVAAVQALTNAGLKNSKDYVDELAFRKDQVRRDAAKAKKKRTFADLVPEERAELQRLIERNDRVGAVTKLQDWLQLGLKVNKDYVDQLVAEYQKERFKH
jgi:ribosomal protein L7/L12